MDDWQAILDMRSLYSIEQLALNAGAVLLIVVAALVVWGAWREWARHLNP